jgi:hypothetical protein
MEAGTGESLGKDCLNPFFAKGAYQCMADRNLAKEINGSDLLDRSLTAENCEAPTLFPVFAQFGVCDGLARFAKFFVLAAHGAAPPGAAALLPPRGYCSMMLVFMIVSCRRGAANARRLFFGCCSLPWPVHETAPGRFFVNWVGGGA